MARDADSVRTKARSMDARAAARPASAANPVATCESFGTTSRRSFAGCVAQLNIAKCGSIDLILQNYERLCDLELPHAVRFDLGLANWLPWCSQYFTPPAHSAYVIAGLLSKTEILLLRSKLLKRGIITAL
jgi:hypothetical protein